MSLRTQTAEFFDSHVIYHTSRESNLRCLLRFLHERRDWLIVDTETTGLDPWTETTYLHSWNDPTLEDETEECIGARIFLIVIGFEDSEGNLHCCWAHREDFQLWQLILCYLSDQDSLKIGHNFKFDLQMFWKEGVECAGDFFDSLTATRFTHDRAKSHSLKYLGNMFAGRSSLEEDRWEKPVKDWLRRAKNKYSRAGFPKNYINYSAVDPDIMIEYALSDVWYTYLVFQMVFDDIGKHYAHLYSMEIEIIKILMDIERKGIGIDRVRCQKAIALLNQGIHRLEISIQRQARKLGFPLFNPNSHGQLKELLYSLKLTDADLMYNGKPSTCKDVIDRLQKKKEIPILNDIVTLRHYHKDRDTYFRSLLRRSKQTGRTRCNFKASDTATGRAACADPNLQNISRPKPSPIPNIRSVFVPKNGKVFVFYDYSQIEMRLFALLAQEKEMMTALNLGRDLHTETAVLMFGTDKKRQEAKAINFGIVFGMGIAKLADKLGISKIEAKKLFNEYYRRFPGVRYLVDSSKSRLYELGYCEDIFLRRYHIPIEKSYVAVNSLVQGSAANVLKFAMVQVCNLLQALGLDKDVNMVLTIHDELVLEMAYDLFDFYKALIKVTMEEVLPVLQYGLTTHVDIDIAEERWDEKSAVEISELELSHARKQLNEVYDEVVLQYDIPKVNWFMKEVA